jgi:hypothetical protein
VRSAVVSTRSPSSGLICNIHVASDGFNIGLNLRFLLSLLAAQNNSIDTLHKVSDAGSLIMQRHARQHHLNIVFLAAAGVDKLDCEALATLPPITSCCESARLCYKGAKEAQVISNRGITAIVLDGRWGALHSNVQWTSSLFESRCRDGLRGLSNDVR